jgi:putative endonuclease
VSLVLPKPRDWRYHKTRIEIFGFLFFNTHSMHYLYILYSKSSQKFYIGETNNINERVIKHNNHSYSNSFTKIANDWEIVLTFNCTDRDEALYLERFIKRMKSKTFNDKIINDPSILKDILSKRN